VTYQLKESYWPNAHRNPKATKGMRLFDSPDAKTTLKLAETKTFKSAVAVLHYLQEKNYRLIMRTLYLFNFVTLDGFFDGRNGDLSWHNVDDEFHEFAIDQLNETDMILFGRITYQMMAAYWPKETSMKVDPIVAGKMNSLPKIVFSRTLEKVEWNNTLLIKENAAAEVSKLKEQSGKDIAILGSSNLAVSLMKLNQIDELRIMINPVALGSGVPLFEGGNNRIRLKLLRSRTFKSGNVLVCYTPTTG